MVRQRPGTVRNTVAALVCAAAFLTQACLAGGPSGAPERPRHSVDTRYVPPTGRTVAVHAGGNLQEALNDAVPGQVIALDPGAVYMGPFVLPAKARSGWIVVRSAAPAGSLPPPGSRIDPGYSRFMPKLEAAGGPVIATAPGAGHYRFIGVEIGPAQEHTSYVGRLRGWLFASDDPHARQNGQAAFVVNLVNLGRDVKRPQDVPDHIIFDRCYIHGDPQVGARRGIAMNSRSTAVIDSYISDIKAVGEDSQAIAAWNGPGPFKIVDNYLSAAGEDVMFGGADPSAPGMIPADIEVRGNHFVKSLRWKDDKPRHKGRHWSVKNLFEIKDGKRALIDGNLFEYNWTDAQNGYAILFTVRNQQGTAPYSTVQDVTFINNVVRHVANGVNILGYDDNHPSRQTSRILIANNLFLDVGHSWGQGGLFQMVDGGDAVHIEHNTALQSGTIIFSSRGHPHTRFIYSGNVTPHNRYGIIGTGTGIGNDTLKTYFPGAVVKSNVFIGGDEGSYPSGNYFPDSIERTSLLSGRGGALRRVVAGGDDGSPTDGHRPPGVDFQALCRALQAGGRHLISKVRSCSAR